MAATDIRADTGKKRWSLDLCFRTLLATVCMLLCQSFIDISIVTPTSADKLEFSIPLLILTGIAQLASIYLYVLQMQRGRRRIHLYALWFAVFSLVNFLVFMIPIHSENFLGSVNDFGLHWAVATWAAVIFLVLGTIWFTISDCYESIEVWEEQHLEEFYASQQQNGGRISVAARIIGQLFNRIIYYTTPYESKRFLEVFLLVIYIHQIQMQYYYFYPERMFSRDDNFHGYLVIPRVVFSVLTILSLIAYALFMCGEIAKYNFASGGLLAFFLIMPATMVLMAQGSIDKVCDMHLNAWEYYFVPSWTIIGVMTIWAAAFIMTNDEKLITMLHSKGEHDEQEPTTSTA